MRQFIASALLGSAVGLLSLSAHAYEPESGIWWNPNEPGTGYAIEIQDNMMAVTIYGGDTNRRAKWYTSVGLLDGNAFFEADLLSFSNVQTIGQSYPGQNVLEPSYGRLKIAFDADDNRRGILTWPNGRSVPIERQEFYFHRGEDSPDVPTPALKMLGEWHVTIDLSSNINSAYPFSADVLVFDDYYREQGAWYYEGCRPDDAQVGGCSNYALDNHDAVGYFEAPTGLQVMLVKDGYYNNQMWYALYVMKVGTNDGSGEFTLYPQGRNPDNYNAFPARVFRTASRTFVQEGIGPSKRASSENAGTSGLASLLHSQAKSASDSRPSQFDRDSLAPIVRALETQLQTR